MKDLLDLIIAFEKRNNISVVVGICSDGSGRITEFWDEEILKTYSNYENLKSFLTETQYKLDESGLCISPVQIVETTAHSKE